MDRRDVLTGLAAAALASQAQARDLAPRTNGLWLRNGLLQVQFDAVHGRPLLYRFQGQTLAGDTFPEPFEAIICQLSPRRYLTLELRAGAPTVTATTMRFPFALTDGDVPAVSFELVYSLRDASLVVTLDHVLERPGYELIELSLPRLVSVGEDRPGAWMAEGRNGGSFVRLAQAKVLRLDDDENFGRISIQLPVGLVGDDHVGCLMEVQSYMDGTETEILGPVGSRQATLGTVQVYRVHGGRCYQANDGGDLVCGDATTPNLLVGQPPLTRLDFYVPAKAAQPWLTGAGILRARMLAPITPYFDDKLIYLIAGKNKTEDKPRTTFAQSRQLIADVARLTDGAPQVNFISGWVYDGQDTGYPSEDKVNASLGTYDDLRALMHDAERWNANVSINVNWDDAYKSSPIFDPAFIARLPNDKLWASRAWDGEVAYIVGMAKFWQGGWGPRRMAYTLERYKIHDAMLIDAMTWFAIRNDWDRQHPASGYKNLVEGKFKIIEAARAGGVHVTSEQLRYPFIGRMALAMNGPTVSDCPFGGEPIPLAAMVYRRASIWGDNGIPNFAPGSNLFWNNRPNNWYEAATPRGDIAAFYYLVTLPFTKLHGLDVTDYDLDGDVRRLSLQDRAQITLSRDGKAYSATWKGVKITENGAVFCPIDADRIAFYATEARVLRYPLPADWDAAVVTARALSLEGHAPFAVSIEAGQITVAAPAGQPVIVYRNAAVAVAAARAAMA